VNSPPVHQHPLARPLRACARGIYPDEAAIELLIGHGTFLDRDDFTRHITTGEHGRPRGGAAHAAIDWTATAAALDADTPALLRRGTQDLPPRSQPGRRAAGQSP
jgi:hypothetical protein